MSKDINKNVVSNRVSFGDGYVLPNQFVESIVGRTLIIIESLGLPQKQEEAVKDLMRIQLYHTYDDAVFIQEDLRGAICEANYKNCEEANKNHIPQSGVKLSDIK